MLLTHLCKTLKIYSKATWQIKKSSWELDSHWQQSITASLFIPKTLGFKKRRTAKGGATENDKARPGVCTCWASFCPCLEDRKPGEGIHCNEGSWNERRTWAVPCRPSWAIAVELHSALKSLLDGLERGNRNETTAETLIYLHLLAKTHQCLQQPVVKMTSAPEPCACPMCARRDCKPCHRGAKQTVPGRVGGCWLGMALQMQAVLCCKWCSNFGPIGECAKSWDLPYVPRGAERPQGQRDQQSPGGEEGLVHVSTFWYLLTGIALVMDMHKVRPPFIFICEEVSNNSRGK